MARIWEATGQVIRALFSAIFTLVLGLLMLAGSVRIADAFALPLYVYALGVIAFLALTTAYLVGAILLLRPRYLAHFLYMVLLMPAVFIANRFAGQLVELWQVPRSIPAISLLLHVNGLIETALARVTRAAGVPPPALPETPFGQGDFLPWSSHSMALIAASIAGCALCALIWGKHGAKT
ncbi:hypothetical protein [Stakelama tenebrarum]|uniref:Uncharacterized protein n=1 Tax=Stakelama tenebrarum TaxID=2711215 RepID=A0A6G6Y868_9SPHN|nr:hypothetical protein [Sphingosinithalassobacter tenebrarum]QIG81109.1 hypothetical protein G5C33_15860 [Sphingosinithalassobacter tenebrarum]